MHFLIFSLLLININAQESANYLQSAIEDLKNMHSIHSQRKVDTSDSKHQRQNIPPLALTKHDLSRLYEAAVNKGDSVILDADTGSHMQAAVYEIEDDALSRQSKKHMEKDHEEDASGYYYYYYPLHSFMDDNHTEHHHDDYPPDQYHSNDHYTIDHHHYPKPTTTHKPKSVHQFHTHKHEHNVHITSIKEKEKSKKSKALEPLFMAISGFVGMAIMFMVSVLVLPKIGVMKPRGVKESSPEVTNIVKIIFQAIEGQDCADRLACELGKTAKAFNVHNNRFTKLIKKIAPSYVSKRLSDIDKYANNKYKCGFIQCKKKTTSAAKTVPVKQKKTKVKF